MPITIAGQVVIIDINSAATIALGVFVGMVVYTIFSNMVYAIRTTFFAKNPSNELQVVRGVPESAHSQNFPNK